MSTASLVFLSLDIFMRGSVKAMREFVFIFEWIPDNTVYNQETQESIRLTSLPFHSISHSLPSPSFRPSANILSNEKRDPREYEGEASELLRR